MRPTAFPAPPRLRLLVGLAALVALLALAAPARGAAWRRPVAGPVARAFAYGQDPFRRGWHRGVDLAAAPGATVRAACSGTVVTARSVATAAGIVTLRCGPWRVTHLPLVAIEVRRGAVVPAGAPLGRLGGSRDHAGLHLGVRRAGDRFGYVDPMRFLGGERRLPPPLITVAPRGGRLGPAPPPAPAPAPAAAPAPARAAVPTAMAAPARIAAATHPYGAEARVRALAPWPAWAGLALLLSGAIGGGVRLEWRRRARASATAAAAKEVA